MGLSLWAMTPEGAGSFSQGDDATDAPVKSAQT